MGKPDVKLLMVTEDNHNKFYNAHDDGNGFFTVTWGRVGTDGSQTTYPISQWEAKINSKLRKGYKDVTSNTAKICEYAPISDAEINKLLNAFLENSRQYVSHFTESTAISDEAAADAQKHINAMAKNIDIPNPDQSTLNAFNRELLKLFEIIPRKMKRVQDELCTRLADRPAHVTKEQSLLDNLVMQTKTLPSSSGTQTIEDAFGFTIAKCSQAEIDFIKNKLAKDGFTRYTFNRAWKVNTPARETGFAEYLANNKLNEKDHVKLYWHGTGTENILSILSNGLLIKPSNASCCGSAYGDGIYNAPNSLKASGYTSIAGSYWKGGTANVAYMFINAVIMGNEYHVKNNYETYGSTGITIRNLNGDNFAAANLNYHSVYAEAGGYLKRDEAIVYNKNQVACRYLVEFKT